MDAKVARTLQSYLDLGIAQREEFLREFNKLRNRLITESVFRGQIRDAIDLGPMGSGVCPYCGK